MTYRIIYQPNGATEGTVPIDPTSYAAGARAIVRPLGTLKRPGSKFVGWRNAATNRTYHAGSSITVTGGITLAAQWVGNVRINYSAANAANVMGRIPVATRRFAIGDTYTIPPYGSVIAWIAPNFKNDGNLEHMLVLTGWKIVAGARGEVEILKAGDKITITGTQVWLEAVWSRDVVSITYEPNGANTGTAPKTQYAERMAYTKIAAPPEDFGRKFYVFCGWENMVNGDVYQPGDSIPIPGPLVLQARWRPDATYTIHYESMGATGTAPDDIDVPHDGSIIIPGIGDLSMIGHDFGGWRRAGTPVVYTPGECVYPITQAMVLEARWVSPEASKQHHITYKHAKSEYRDPSDYITGDVAIIVSPDWMPPTNQYFDGWVDAEGKRYAPDDYIYITDDMVLTAVYADMPKVRIDFVAGADGVGGKLPAPIYILRHQFVTFPGFAGMSLAGHKPIYWMCTDPAIDTDVRYPGDTAQFADNIPDKISYKAIWADDRTDYRVTYIDSTHTSGSVPVDPYKYALGESIPVAPTTNMRCVGLMLTGWRDDRTNQFYPVYPVDKLLAYCGDNGNDNTCMLPSLTCTGDHNLVGVWVPAARIYFGSIGATSGAPEFDEITVTQDVGVYVPGFGTLQRDGYVATRWRDEARNVILMPRDHYIPPDPTDTILQPVWEKLHSVRWVNTLTDIPDKTWIPKDGYVQDMHAVHVAIPTVSWQSHTLQGWIRSDTGELISADTDVSPTEDITFTAKFSGSEIKCTVKWAHNDSTQAITAGGMIRGGTINAPNFCGWTRNNGVKVYAPGTDIPVHGNTVVRPYFDPTHYTIEYVISPFGETVYGQAPIDTAEYIAGEFGMVLDCKQLANASGQTGLYWYTIDTTASSADNHKIVSVYHPGSRIRIGNTSKHEYAGTVLRLYPMFAVPLQLQIEDPKQMVIPYDAGKITVIEQPVPGSIVRLPKQDDDPKKTPEELKKEGAMRYNIRDDDGGVIDTIKTMTPSLSTLVKIALLLGGWHLIMPSGWGPVDAVKGLWRYVVSTWEKSKRCTIHYDPGIPEGEALIVDCPEDQQAYLHSMHKVSDVIPRRKYHMFKCWRLNVDNQRGAIHDKYANDLAELGKLAAIPPGGYMRACGKYNPVGEDTVITITAVWLPIYHVSWDIQGIIKDHPALTKNYRVSECKDSILHTYPKYLVYGYGVMVGAPQLQNSGEDSYAPMLDRDFVLIRRGSSSKAIDFKKVLGCEHWLPKYVDPEAGVHVHSELALESQLLVPFGDVMRGFPRVYGSGIDEDTRAVQQSFGMSVHPFSLQGMIEAQGFDRRSRDKLGNLPVPESEIGQKIYLLEEPTLEAQTGDIFAGAVGAYKVEFEPGWSDYIAVRYVVPLTPAENSIDKPLNVGSYFASIKMSADEASEKGMDYSMLEVLTGVGTVSVVPNWDKRKTQIMIPYVVGSDTCEDHPCNIATLQIPDLGVGDDIKTIKCEDKKSIKYVRNYGHPLVVLGKDYPEIDRLYFVLAYRYDNAIGAKKPDDDIRVFEGWEIAESCGFADWLKKNNKSKYLNRVYPPGEKITADGTTLRITPDMTGDLVFLPSYEIVKKKDFEKKKKEIANKQRTNHEIKGQTERITWEVINRSLNPESKVETKDWEKTVYGTKKHVNNTLVAGVRKRELAGANSNLTRNLMIGSGVAAGTLIIGGLLYAWLRNRGGKPRLPNLDVIAADNLDNLPIGNKGDEKPLLIAYADDKLYRYDPNKKQLMQYMPDELDDKKLFANQFMGGKFPEQFVYLEALARSGGQLVNLRPDGVSKLWFSLYNNRRHKIFSQDKNRINKEIENEKKENESESNDISKDDIINSNFNYEHNKNEEFAQNDKASDSLALSDESLLNAQTFGHSPHVEFSIGVKTKKTEVMPEKIEKTDDDEEDGENEVDEFLKEFEKMEQKSLIVQSETKLTKQQKKQMIFGPTGSRNKANGAPDDSDAVTLTILSPEPQDSTGCIYPGETMAINPHTEEIEAVIVPKMRNLWRRGNFADTSRSSSVYIDDQDDTLRAQDDYITFTAPKEPAPEGMVFYGWADIDTTTTFTVGEQLRQGLQVHTFAPVYLPAP